MNDHEHVQLPASYVLRLFVIGVMVATILPISVTLYIDHQNSGDRLRENKALIERFSTENKALTRKLNNERIQRQALINKFIYEQCVRAEIRDVVLVQHFQENLRVYRKLLPAKNPLLARLTQDVNDQIAVLEPEGEKDCVPPPARAP